MGLKKILVVEDNEDNRDILVYRLKHIGSYEILVASNGREAIETAAQIKPDLIFMDLKMPVMDGLEATRLLRQSDWGKSLPVIAITALAVDGDREKALDAGCTDYIPKPIVDYSIIERKVRDLIG